MKLSNILDSIRYNRSQPLDIYWYKYKDFGKEAPHGLCLWVNNELLSQDLHDYSLDNEISIWETSCDEKGNVVLTVWEE